MQLTVEPAGPLAGTVPAPPSKSYTHRAVLLAALGRNCTVRGPLDSEDTRHTASVCAALGATLTRTATGDLAVHGVGGAPRFPANGHLQVGESGTLLRLLLPVLCLGRGTVNVAGRGSLVSRPNREMVETLRAAGIDIAGQGPEHTLPITLTGRGDWPGGVMEIDGSRSSQYVSGLLMAAAFARRPTTVSIRGQLVSRPYVDITLDMLERAGIRVCEDTDAGRPCFHITPAETATLPATLEVPGDYSSAAFLLAAAVLTGGQVTVTRLYADRQGDRRIVELLAGMGARIRHAGDGVTVDGAAALRGMDIDGGATPDLCPILTTLACFAQGETRITNVHHLAIKESNRLAEPAGQLRRLGADITHTADTITVRPRPLHAARVDGCNDHRVAMALAVAGLRLDAPLVIDGMECMAKSYPGFVCDLQALGARVHVA